MTDPTTLRNRLVDHMKQRGSITNRAIESAFRDVPRHLFVPPDDAASAYQDRVILLKTDAQGVAISSSSQPTMMAIMLHQLKLKPGMRVLEIGAGSGYNAALMAHLVGERGQIVTIDIDDDLVAGARRNLQRAGYDKNVEVICGDGAYGHADFALYDRIILTAAGWDITPQWREQLSPKGRIVMPLVIDHLQFSGAFVRRKDRFVSESVSQCRFMSMRGDSPGKSGMLTLNLGDNLSARIKRLPDETTTAAIGVDVLRGLLDDPTGSIDTGVMVNGYDIRNKLGTVDVWADIQGMRHCAVFASGNTALSDVIPYLGGGRSSYRMSAGFVVPDGLMLLSRPSDFHFPDEPDPNTHFPLNLITYGDNGANLAADYLMLLKQWDAAKRPDSHNLNIRIQPQDNKIRLKAGEIALQKRWNTFVLAWR